MSVVSETEESVEITNFHSNPTYESTLSINWKVEENIKSSDQEFDRLWNREIIRRSIQLPERSPNCEMFVDSETDDSGESDGCHINPSYESASNIYCKVKENTRSGDQELHRLSNREIIRRSIQLPERGPMRKPCIQLLADPDTDDSEKRGNYDINHMYESILNSNYKVEENTRSGDQELDRLSNREIIRRSIRLPERGPMRKPCIQLLADPDTDDSEKRGNYDINHMYESILNSNYKVEEIVRSRDQEHDRLSHREMIRRSIQLPERGPMLKPCVSKFVDPETDDSEESGNCHINPSYESTLNINCNVEENVRSRNQEFDHLSYREIIRRSIQLPESPPTRRKLFRCKLLDKQDRLFVAYVLLVVLFVMTFWSIGISIIIQTIQLKFFPECWTITIALSSLTSLIGLYICWEDDICRSPRTRQEEIIIDIELTTFP